MLIFHIYADCGSCEDKKSISSILNVGFFFIIISIIIHNKNKNVIFKTLRKQIIKEVNENSIFGEKKKNNLSS